MVLHGEVKQLARDALALEGGEGGETLRERNAEIHTATHRTNKMRNAEENEDKHPTKKHGARAVHTKSKQRGNKL